MVGNCRILPWAAQFSPSSTRLSAMNMAELVAGVRDAATNGDKHESPKSKAVITMTLTEQLALHKQQHGALQVNLCLK